ncbi:MAG: hypothetical protein VYA30_03060 [Myxococcota bacterium]|nr:hypothetical protein [Myxococcota bacterium]
MKYNVFLTVILTLMPLCGHSQTSPTEPTSLGVLACDPALEFMEPLRYLRALSLDLRGTVPTLDELQLVQEQGEVPESLIDDWLQSDAFATQAVRFHRKLLWNNVSNINLFSAGFRLGRQNGILWIRNRAMRYRGQSVPCRDEPAQFSADGSIITDENGIEGYVEIIPYWSADREPVRICAFDAQDRLVSEGGAECRLQSGTSDTACGCGPSLRWCTTGQEQRSITESMGEALDRFMFSIFRGNRPYTDLFTSRMGFINGPLTYFWLNQTGANAGLVFEPAPLNKDTLMPMPYTARDAWREVELPESHAGVLTRTAFLLRFQTNRSRANRFYDAFLCQPFNPPDGGLPVADEESARNPDLQLRAGCKYCHALLEPAAAHWGRWTEQGVGYLTPEDFPATRGDCEACALRGQSCNRECRNFYAIQSFAPAEDDFLGMLNAYKFRRADHVRNVEVGPKLLALSTVTDNRMPGCVARRAAEWLLGQGIAGDEDVQWVDELARQFVFSDLSYQALVKQIVMSPRYRRVR